MKRMIQVLVIDGDRLNRVLLRGILEHEGLQVLDASVEQLGLQILRAAPCDLVITDTWMADSAGEELFGELLMEFPETRFIVLTPGRVLRKPPLLEGEQKRGIVRTLVKPVFRQELLLAIQELFPEWQPREGDGESRHGL